MPIKTKKVETSVDLDMLPEPEDTDRNDALERGFLEHDTIQFDGELLNPICAGTLSLLQRTNNGFLRGDTSRSLEDSAAFVLIHQKDNIAVRRAIYAGYKGEFEEIVFEYLHTLPDAQGKLTGFADTISRMFEDYTKTLTSPMSGGGDVVKKNYGARTGSRQSARR
jgi:hypothetical protein